MSGVCGWCLKKQKEGFQLGSYMEEMSMKAKGQIFDEIRNRVRTGTCGQQAHMGGNWFFFGRLNESLNGRGRRRLVSIKRIPCALPSFLYLEVGTMVA